MSCQHQRRHHKLASAHQRGAIPWQRSLWASATSLPANTSPGRAASLPGDVVAMEVRSGLRIILQGPVTWPLATSLMADTSTGCATCSPGGVVALEVQTGLWGIAQGPLTSVRRWPLRAFCGFDAATGITSLMLMLPLLFALSAQAEGTSARSHCPRCCHPG